MHTRRVITFLLGIWIGCNVLLGLIALRNFSSPDLVLNSPLPPVVKMTEKLGGDEVRLLLRHLAMEQTRAYFNVWEAAQMLLGLVLLFLLFMSSPTRILPMALVGVMVLLVLFQHFAIMPELIYRSRLADFPPGNGDFATQARVWTLSEIYVGMEIGKLILGGILSSYLFVFYASPKRPFFTDPVEVDG
jgi:hypothetical protein